MAGLNFILFQYLLLVRRNVVKKLFVLVAVGLLVLAASCDTKNIGTELPSRGPVPTVSVPGTMNGGADATWTVNWIGGQAPYTVSWNFGGGAANVGPVAATSPNAQTVTMINPSLTDNATYTYTVTVTDSLGLQGVATGSYTVGPTLNTAPEITNVDYTGTTLTVSVDDVDGDDVTVTPGAVAGLSFSPANVVVSVPGDAVFSVSADDFIAGGNGTTTITADDGNGGTDTADQALTVDGVTFEADTIYVLPTTNSAGVGDPVTFICATGTMANPFQFLNGVGVIVEEDADYVANSFNIGNPGGAAGDADGDVWSAVNPSGFLLADNLIQATASGGGNSIPAGRERWGFNATGLGGSDVNGAAGMLFNFQFTFGSAGTKSIGLQAVDGVNRTYYSDSSSTEYFWGTLMADADGNLNVTGVDNTVEIN